MKNFIYLLFIVLTLFAFTNAFAQSWHPQKPDLNMTPGALCHNPTELRYHEEIFYCKRDVPSELKWSVINEYVLLYPELKINPTNRYEFKIDHFIPLCMGGGNDITNLWPQHMDVYKYTDKIELALCTQMSEGLLLQAEAIAEVKYAKLNIELWKDNPEPLKFIQENYKH